MNAGAPDWDGTCAEVICCHSYEYNAESMGSVLGLRLMRGQEKMMIRSVSSWMIVRST